MEQQLLLPLIIALPLLPATLIRIIGERPNPREAVTVVTAVVVLGLLGILAGDIYQGERPAFTFAEPIPGLPIRFDVEPLGMLFALVAGSLWLVTSIYAIGYMRGHHEQNQTRFFMFFAIAIASTLSVSFS